GFNQTVVGLYDGGVSTGTITNSVSGVKTLTINDTGSDFFYGTISGGANLALTKSGVGTLELGGTNSYSGATAVNGGTLRVTNASALGTSPVTVGAGILEIGG